jgi:hypothetical protein
MITVLVTGDKEVAARFEKLPGAAHSRLVREMQRITIDLQNYVRDSKLSGQVLKNRTGTLRRSINQRVEESGSTITGIVGANLGAARYAAAQEYGATIHLPEIVPVRARALRFVSRSGDVVFARRVAAHDVTLPERSYLRSSLSEKRDEYTGRLASAVGEVING